MTKFHDYCSVIFWDFNRMDNVEYNFTIIGNLIRDSANSKNKSSYYKPLTILIVGIIECVLYDFLCRVKQERHEGINLSKEEKDILRDKKWPDKFKCYIDICKKHNLLGNKVKLYDSLHDYAKIRNRVHIQNINKYEPDKEPRLWNNKTVRLSGELLHEVFLHLCKKFPRPDKFHNNPNLDLFPTPWNNF